MPILFTGTIARSECGMKIGWGKGVDNFVGCIDEVSSSYI